MMDQWKTVNQCQFEAVNSVLNRNVGNGEESQGKILRNSIGYGSKLLYIYSPTLEMGDC